LAILVKNEKKKETVRPSSVTTATSGSIDRKRKSPSVHRTAAQSSSQTQCVSGHSGPVILYTTMVITVLYALIAACGYVYYRHFVKRFTDARYSCAPTSISVRPASIGSMVGHDNFNLAVNSTHNKTAMAGPNKVPSMFYGNLNETIRSFANSSVSGYHQLFGSHDLPPIPVGPEVRKPNANASRSHKSREFKMPTATSTTAPVSEKRTYAPSTQSSFQSMYHSHPSVYGLPP
jgi:hypothetical protein